MLKKCRCSPCDVCLRCLYQWAEVLNKPLTETDPEIDDIMEHEKLRQRKSIVLIASEVRQSRNIKFFFVAAPLPQTQCRSAALYYICV